MTVKCVSFIMHRILHSQLSMLQTDSTEWRIWRDKRQKKRKRKEIHTTAAVTGAISERSSPTHFVVEMAGGTEDELATSVPAE